MFAIKYMATGQLVERGGKVLRFSNSAKAWDVAIYLTVAAVLADRLGDGFVAVSF